MKKKKLKVKPTILGHCCCFTSYYCPSEIFSLAFKVSEYDQRKKEIQEACKKLSVKNRVTAVMNHEFSAYKMLEFGFSMGYIMGQLYNIKDREHLPVLKKFFKSRLVAEERKQAERRGVPYIGKATKRLEKKAT